jgi:UDP-N-acetylmuramoyl-L-alanyl-D-glutamate--2,6-diaminopimelate ligase
VLRVTTVGVFVSRLVEQQSERGDRGGHRTIVDERLDVPSTHEGFLHATYRLLDLGGKYASIEFTSEALARGFAQAWPPRIAVFTNLTHDHLDAHGSPEHYLASKAQLFLALPKDGIAVLDGCDEACALLAEIVPKHARIVRYGVPSRGEPHAPLDLEAQSLSVSWEGTRVELAPSPWLEDRAVTLHVRGIGEVYAENALAALAGALAGGISLDAALGALAIVAPPPGRFEVVTERPWVVVDYAHSPDALARTVRAARGLCKGTLTVVFGAGGDRDRDKRAPMGEAASIADRVILTTDNPRREDPAAIAAAIRGGLSGHPRVEVILDRAAAIHEAITTAALDDVILVAGKGHEVEQIIGDERRAFSDHDVARAAFHARKEAPATT